MSSNLTSTYSLGDVADVYDGPHATPKKLEQGDAIFLSISSLEQGRLNLEQSSYISEEDYIKWTRRVTPQPGDVVFSYETKIGEASIIPEGLRCCLGRRMGLLRAKRNKVIPDFLLYAYLSPAFQEVIREKTIHGSTTDRLSIKEMPSFKIQIPDVRKQNGIIKILKSIDDKLELNQQVNKTLEQMAQALFKSWFVDFEPVKAKMAVLESGGSQADAMLAAMTAISGKDADALAVFEREHPEQYAELKATAELFPSAMRESELGEIPEGWYQTLLSELTGFLNGYAFKSKDWRETGFPVVKIGSVKPGFVDLKNCSYIDGIGIKNLERFEVFSGDILVGMTGYPGETGIIPETMQRVYLNQRVGKFTPLFEFLYSYVYTLVRNNNFKIYVSGQAHGSAQANISSNDILQYPVVKPNDALLRAFDVVVRNLISLKL
ncbi:TPA: restriction endonuclease subunit S, partial [Klebsiella pneumoniae]